MFSKEEGYLALLLADERLKQ